MSTGKRRKFSPDALCALLGRFLELAQPLFELLRLARLEPDIHHVCELGGLARRQVAQRGFR